MRRAFAALLLCASLAFAQAPADKKEAAPARIADKIGKAQKLDGYFPLYWDAQSGKLWLEVPADRWDAEFLFLDSLPAGIGSNDIGLDRGQLGEGRVVKFERSGPRVLLTQVNYDFRAGNADPAERRAVEQSFAKSVLWGFDVAADEQGRVLLDATNFFLQDAHEVIASLRRAKQGTYRLEASRSAIYLPQTRNFPKNTEVESTLTFLGDEPGQWVRQVTPNPRSITVREHYSLIQLPDAGYTPRAFDPRAGFFGIDYMDYSVPIGDDVHQRLIARHRLRKKDPNAAVSEPVEPIVYYLDPGAPEPVRSALLEGARWWNQAFEAAGYKNAFRVEMLPPDADPMDIRYNMIQWVHRSTRGWSYGGGVTDPRTGEIIKGQVTLGSLRDRQDYLIAEALLAPYSTGKPADPRMLQMALARLRQLAAHEVGHTLGLAHNYIASTAGRASVMDYPHPLIKFASDGSIDLSDAYATGIGEWDKVAITYGYSEFPAGADEHAALDGIIQRARSLGLIFLTDQDARPPGSAHPYVHLWDNGKDPADELEHMLQVRQQALARFGENNIKPGAPWATLEEPLVPLYLSHRYQTEATAKVLGGLQYTYALRGDGQVPTTPVAPAQQKRALDVLLKTLSPEALTLPENIIRAIPPHPAGFPRHRELFNNFTGMTFDPLAAASTAADMTADLILNSFRAERLVEHNSRDAQQPGLGYVIDRLLTATWKAPRRAGFAAEVQRTVDDAVLYRLMSLAADEHAANQPRAIALQRLKALRTWAEAQAAAGEEQRAHLQFATTEISRFEREPSQVLKPTEPKEPPPGQPIGSFACDDEE